jgi:hypothetical protein
MLYKKGGQKPPFFIALFCKCCKIFKTGKPAYQTAPADAYTIGKHTLYGDLLWDSQLI